MSCQAQLLANISSHYVLSSANVQLLHGYDELVATRDGWEVTARNMEIYQSACVRVKTLRAFIIHLLSI